MKELKPNKQYKPDLIPTPGQRTPFENVGGSFVVTSPFVTAGFIPGKEGFKISSFNEDDSQVPIKHLTAGTITSKEITLEVSPNAGDVKIQAGKTDFGDATAGFILGIDDSDSDLAKFEIGNSTDFLKWDGSTVQISSNTANAITIEYGSDILLKEGGDLKFTKVSSPGALTAALITVAGNVDAGTHKYAVVYVNAAGETSVGTDSNTVTNDGSNQQNALTGIPVSSSGSVTARKIYRTKAGASQYFLLTTISDNTTTTYTDNTADSSLTGIAVDEKDNTSFGKIIIDDAVSVNLASINSFVGQNSGAALSDGIHNAGFGSACMFLNTTGSYNTAIGAIAMRQNTTGSFNTAIGYSAGYENTTGDYNTSIGRFALENNSTGDSNIAVGYFAGNYETGSDAFYVNNQDRTNTSGDKTKSIIYGVMHATALSQAITFNVGTLNLLDGGNIATGTGTGLKIGTATGQKIGFHNATPVVQAAHIVDATDAADVITRVNAILVVLENKGFTATS